MSFSVNGQSCVPPGFRFHPTEEELLHYYLRKKVAFEKIDLEVIPDIDLNKLEPWEIQEKCKIGSTPQNDWYFFSHKDKKYPTGTRTNRATVAGFWKATGRDKPIFMDFKQIGMRKTLVFYIGRAPHGKKSDWIMHEYRLEETIDTNSNSNAICYSEATQEEGWVVCRVFKKKSHIRNVDTCPDSHHNPALDSTRVDISSQFAPPGLPESSLCAATHVGGYFDETCCFSSSMTQDVHEVDRKARQPEHEWAGLERLVAMHLHARVETTTQDVELLGEGTSVGYDLINTCEAYDEGLHVLHRAREHASDQKCEVELWNLVR